MQIISGLCAPHQKVYYPVQIQSYHDDVVVCNNGKIWYELNTDKGSKYLYRPGNKDSFYSFWNPEIYSEQFVFNEYDESNSYTLEAITTPPDTISELIYEDVPNDWKPVMESVDTITTYITQNNSIRAVSSLSYQNTTINTGVSSVQDDNEVDEVLDYVFIDKILSSGKIVLSVINDNEDTTKNQYFVLNNDESTWSVIDDVTMRSYGDPAILTDIVYAHPKKTKSKSFSVQLDAELAAKMNRISYSSIEPLKPHIQFSGVVKLYSNKAFSYPVVCDNVTVNYSLDK